MKILVTGAAGFIGAGVMSALAGRGDAVVGLDSINAYYDVRLKYARLAECGFTDRAALESGVPVRSASFADCRFVRMDVTDRQALEALFAAERFDKVVHLAAQAGIRHGIVAPYDYVGSNLTGFVGILEACRRHGVKHLVYASSSSVYGLNGKADCRESDRTDRPASLYAATKKADELLAHSYCALFGFACTGLRFFTVYGPWGRPDMSPTLFASAILRDEPVRLFNRGEMVRDFTYIDDIVAGTVAALDRFPEPNEDGLPYRIYNLGCGAPVKVSDFVSRLAGALGKKAKTEELPVQPGEVLRVGADTRLLEAETGFRPRVSLDEGLGRFVEWYLSEKNPLHRS